MGFLLHGDTVDKHSIYPHGRAAMRWAKMPRAVASLRGVQPMSEKTMQSVANLGYHAHIYYDPTRTRAVAERVCAALGEKFPVEIDGFRDTPIGPHPIANVLVIFKPDQFQHVVPYLMLNRDGLDVLVHPLTEDAVEDHSSYAMWLGKPVELKLHTLPHGRGGRLPSGVNV
jgi:aromatic ring-cleaving dioxygenase